MSLMTWGEKYSLDVQDIDEQHKELFALFNKLDSSIEAGKEKEVLIKELNDLIDFTIIHFVAEEKMMKEFSYVGYLEHKRVHDELIDEARALKEKYDKDQVELSGNASSFLTTWLTDHIIDMDKKYSALFKSKGLG